MNVTAVDTQTDKCGVAVNQTQSKTFIAASVSINVPAWQQYETASTTGLTISKCDGLNAKETCIGPCGWRCRADHGISTSPWAIWFRHGLQTQRTNLGFLKCSAKTFQRPRCAIPAMMASSTPSSRRFESGSSSKAIALAAFDTETFWPTYLVCG